MLDRIRGILIRVLIGSDDYVTNRKPMRIRSKTPRMRSSMKNRIVAAGLRLDYEYRSKYRNIAITCVGMADFLTLQNSTFKVNITFTVRFLMHKKSIVYHNSIEFSTYSK